MSRKEQETGAATVAAWGSVFSEEGKAGLEAVLPDYLRGRRWFSAKARAIADVRVVEAIPFSEDASAAPLAYITFIQVRYAEGDTQLFVLPLAISVGGEGEAQSSEPGSLVARLEVGGSSHALLDASWSAPFARALLASVEEGRRFGAASAQVRAWPTPLFSEVAGPGASSLAPRIVGADQSNTSIIFGDRLILKLFRRLEAGVSPDLEIGRFLTEEGFANIPALAGAVELVGAGAGEPQTLAILQGFVPNKGDAWSHTLQELGAYFDRSAAYEPQRRVEPGEGHPLDLAGEEPAEDVHNMLGDYLDAARLLGRRTAELHLALASQTADAAFAPEPLTGEYQRSLFDSIQTLADNAFALLRDRLDALPEATRKKADIVLHARSNMHACLEALLGPPVAATRTRCHGDYHLGQVLWTGADFIIIDFEGEPLRSLEERRLKHSPLKDVAGMLRSFHYAAYAAMFARGGEAEKSQLEYWARLWNRWVGAGFLSEYLKVAQGATFLPRQESDLRVLLDAYLLEKAIYELVYELNNRPDWVRIPLEGIRQLAHPTGGKL